MSQYHYNFSQGGGPGRQNGGGLIETLLDLALSVILAIPSVIALVLGKLGEAFSNAENAPGQSKATAPDGTYHYSYKKQAAPSGASNLHQVQRPQAAPSGPQPDKKKGKELRRGVKVTAGRGLMVLGGLITCFFGIGLAGILTDGADPAGLVAVGVFMALGAFTFGLGLRRRKKAKLYLKYLGLIGRRETVDLTALAQAAGRSHKKVCRELQDMLDQGILPTGYLDLAADKLVLSTQGIADRPAPEPEREERQEDENQILRQIKEINDAIPDPVMSAKIDRIGEITGKILDYQRKNPSRASQLRSFLNYYLPTTLKILRAYAQLDKQGVEGENISAAKARIEGMMDKVVEGFEKQLDRLFQDDALDITSDVAVLEQMLEKDGLNQDATPFGV